MQQYIRLYDTIVTIQHYTTLYKTIKMMTLYKIIHDTILHRLSKVRGSWFLEATDFCHPQARQIHRCSFAPVTSVNAHYYSVLTTPFDMVNAHYVIIDFRAKFFIKIQNQASDTSHSLPSFSSAPFLLRAVPSERLGQDYTTLHIVMQHYTTLCKAIRYYSYTMLIIKDYTTLYKTIIIIIINGLGYTPSQKIELWCVYKISTLHIFTYIKN